MLNFSASDFYSLRPQLLCLRTISAAVDRWWRAWFETGGYRYPYSKLYILAGTDKVFCDFWQQCDSLTDHPRISSIWEVHFIDTRFYETLLTSLSTLIYVILTNLMHFFRCVLLWGTYRILLLNYYILCCYTILINGTVLTWQKLPLNANEHATKQARRLDAWKLTQFCMHICCYAVLILKQYIVFVIWSFIKIFSAVSFVSFQMIAFTTNGDNCQRMHQSRGDENHYVNKAMQ